MSTLDAVAENPQVSGFRSQVSHTRPRVTCLFLVHNEAERIGPALRHALKWADEVLVLDKESTDATAAIARAAGARVVTVPFTRQGHEEWPPLVAHASHDWIWAFTPGEVPTRECIERGLALIDDTVDVIRVPMRYYSFGVHHPRSPWAGGHQPRLYHRGRVNFTGMAHDPIRCPFPRSRVIDSSPTCHVLHQTHAAADSFVRSHADYAINEAAPGTPNEAMARAMEAHSAFDQVFDSDHTLIGQCLGWKLYWLTVALHAWERAQPSIPATYKARAESMLAEHWS
jgi:hypothetical protein